MNKETIAKALFNYKKATTDGTDETWVAELLLEWEQVDKSSILAQTIYAQASVAIKALEAEKTDDDIQEWYWIDKEGIPHKACTPEEHRYSDMPPYTCIYCGKDNPNIEAEVSKDEIHYQVQYVLDNNPTIPLAVSVSAMVWSACKEQLAKVAPYIEAVKKAERAKVISEIDIVSYECPYGYTHICLHMDEYETMVKTGGE